MFSRINKEICVWVVEYVSAPDEKWANYYTYPTGLEFALSGMAYQVREHPLWTFRIRNIRTDETIPGALF